MKKLCIALLITAIVMAAVIPMNVGLAVTISSSDYASAFTKSIQFYDANRCGSGVATGNVFSWRSACHTTDGSDIGKDLSGGFHDAGDHVKFGLPQAYSAAVLGTALYEFKSGFDAQGNTSKMLSTLKYFTDYFLKCHTDANTFYYQVGDGNADHSYWGAPELQSGSRPTLYVANASNPASDVCGTTAAALALMYLNYKSIDATYAGKCLTAAKELYALGKNYKGLSSGQTFYVSNGYWDDLALAATWLYVAENNSAYLADVDSYLSNNTKWGNSPYLDQWTFCWDSVYDLVMCKMAELTGQQKYKDAMTFNFNFWKTGITTTPGGLKYLPPDGWGSLRYASAESMLALLYYKQTSDPWLTSFAKSQLDYILGANPMNMSYVIGFGSTYPKHPHHRAANPTMGTATYTLTGALIGGPNSQDQFMDDVNQYSYTEVALDYNAGFVGALAGAVKYLSGGTATATPVPTATPTPAATATPIPTATPTPAAATATPAPTVAPTPGPRSAFTQVEAESYDTQSGIQTESCTEGGQDIGYIENGDYVIYNNIDFGSGAASFQARVASTANGSNIEIRLDSITGPLVGTCPVAGTGGWQTWATSTCSVSGASGMHNLYLKFTGGSGYLFNINWFKFTVGSATATPMPATATPTPTPTATATPVPATATPTPASTPGAGGIKVMMYNGTTTSSAQSLNPRFKLVNTGTAAINLSDVKIRYYFTQDGTQALAFNCDWATIGNSNVTATFTPITRTNADTYCEIGFTSSAGTLAAGTYIEIFTQIHKTDWSSMTQTNDYSFNSTAASYVDWNNVTGYVASALKWGTEP